MSRIKFLLMYPPEYLQENPNKRKYDNTMVEGYLDPEYYIGDDRMWVETWDKDVFPVKTRFLYQTDGSEPPPVPVCECGAQKVYGKACNKYYHAYWCKLSEL